MYESEFTREFLDRIKKLKKKDNLLFKRLESKIEEILENPSHYKPLRDDLKGTRRVHVGHFVIIFKIEDETVIFISFKHHNDAY
jgi:YafQ family addiction module toxin component